MPLLTTYNSFNLRETLVSPWTFASYVRLHTHRCSRTDARKSGTGNSIPMLPCKAKEGVMNHNEPNLTAGHVARIDTMHHHYIH